MQEYSPDHVSDPIETVLETCAALDITPRYYDPLLLRKHAISKRASASQRSSGSPLLTIFSGARKKADLLYNTGAKREYIV